MNERMLAVMQRRGELLAKIEAQRGQLERLAEQWETPLAVASQGMGVLRYLRAHPVLLAGLTVGMVARRRGMLGVLRVAWRAWRGHRYFTRFAEKLSPRH